MFHENQEPDESRICPIIACGAYFISVTGHGLLPCIWDTFYYYKEHLDSKFARLPAAIQERRPDSRARLKSSLKTEVTAFALLLFFEMHPKKTF